MSNDDLAIFNQAVQEATTNPVKVYDVLKELVSRNRNDPNLLSWLVFTAPDYVSKEKWLNHAKVVAPQNETVMQAEQWFNQQPKPAMPVAPPPFPLIPQPPAPQQITHAQFIPGARPEIIPINRITMLTKNQLSMPYFIVLAAGAVALIGMALPFFTVRSGLIEFSISTLQSGRFTNTFLQSFLKSDSVSLSDGAVIGALAVGLLAIALVGLYKQQTKNNRIGLAAGMLVLSGILGFMVLMVFISVQEVAADNEVISRANQSNGIGFYLLLLSVIGGIGGGVFLIFSSKTLA
jgi:hypothetical protein